MAYRHNKSWRKRNTAKRTRQTIRYYARNRQIPRCVRRQGEKWERFERKLIRVNWRPTDRKLSLILGRTIYAIQRERVKLNKKDEFNLRKRLSLLPGQK